MESKETLDFSLYHKRTHLSPSSMSCLERCPRRFFFQCGCCIESPGVKLPLKYGEAVHYAIPFAHRGDIDAAMSAWSKIWGSLEGDKKRNLERARSMLHNFHQAHIGDRGLYELERPPKSIEVQEKVSDDEVPFALDLGLPVPVVGRIDAVGRMMLTDELWGVEYKTTSELSSRFLGGFSLSPQVLTYTLALQASSTEQVKGIIVEGLRVSHVNSETMGVPVYVRQEALRDIISWYRKLWSDLVIYEELKHFPKNLGACTPYSGFGTQGFLCDYQPLCMTDNWKQYLSMFEIGKPRPFLIDEKKEGEENA